MENRKLRVARGLKRSEFMSPSLGSCWGILAGPDLLSSEPHLREAGFSRVFAATRKEAGHFCGSFLLKGEEFAICWAKLPPSGPDGRCFTTHRPLLISWDHHLQLCLGFRTLSI